MFQFIARYVRFVCLLMVKSLRYFLYPTKVHWLSTPPSRNWNEVKVIVILNHTSLMEFIYAGVVPIRYLFQIARRLVLPVASKTMEKPFYRLLYSGFAPHLVSLSRKRDETWSRFLDKLAGNPILIFMPEGRMKRRNGLDKDGQVMTVRAGIVDVLDKVEGKMLLVYSAGLHHVFAPGDWCPRIFRRLHVNMEIVDIPMYLRSLDNSTAKNLRKAVTNDLEMRRDRFCPVLPQKV